MAQTPTDATIPTTVAPRTTLGASVTSIPADALEAARTAGATITSPARETASATPLPAARPTPASTSAADAETDSLAEKPKPTISQLAVKLTGSIAIQVYAQNAGVSDPKLGSDITAMEENLAAALLESKSASDPEAARASVKAYAAALRQEISRKPDQDLKHVATSQSKLLGEEAAFNSVADTERYYLEQVRKYEEQKELRAALAQYDSLSDMNTALVAFAEPPLQANLPEIIKNTPKIAERGLTHLNSTVGLIDSSGNKVKLSAAELDKGSAIIGYIAENEYHRFNNRYDGIFGDANYRATDIVTGIGSAGREGAQGLGSLLSGALGGYRDADSSPEGAGFGTILKNGIGAVPGMATEAASRTGESLGTAGGDIKADLTWAHSDAINQNISQSIASMRDGVLMNRIAAIGAEKFEPQTLERMKKEDPKLYEEILAITKANDPDATEPTIKSLIIAGSKVHNGALGSVAFALTGAVAARDKHPKHFEYQVRPSRDMFGRGSTEDAVTFADAFAGGKYPIAPDMAAKYDIPETYGTIKEAPKAATEKYASEEVDSPTPVDASLPSVTTASASVTRTF